jgi:alkylation response protein AidB-like acyl-CoA dehydrogenase
MDFSYSDEQQAAIDLARQILSDHCTPQRLRELDLADGPRFDRALWQKVAEAGLLAAGLTEDDGGADLGFLAVAGIVEQAGRSAAPVPLLEATVLGLLPLARFGSAAQKERWLGRAVAGEVILTSALVEAHREAAEPATEARPEGDTHRLHGEKLCVPAGELADAVLVPARLPDGGVGVFLVETGADGVSQTPLVTTSRQPESILRLDGAAGELLGAPEAGAEIVAWIELRATAALCALAVGVCAEALHLTAEYTKTRKQFDQPIATFRSGSARPTPSSTRRACGSPRSRQPGASTRGSRPRRPWRRRSSGPRRAAPASCAPRSTCTVASASTASTRCTATTRTRGSSSSGWAAPRRSCGDSDA